MLVDLRGIEPLCNHCQDDARHQSKPTGLRLTKLVQVSIKKKSNNIEVLLPYSFLPRKAVESASNTEMW